MRSFILGTDFFSDCDDAVALRVLTRAVKAKKAELLGIGINACTEHSAASVLGFLAADGLFGIPVGIDRGAVGYEGEDKCTYQKRLARDFAPEVTNADAEDAVALYRRLLARATEKVEIIEIGFLGILSELLKSVPDGISKKSGAALVREKVSKIWVMGGKWDENGGREHNFALNASTRSAAADFTELCPVPVTFLGFEVGIGVITGRNLNTGDHLYRVMKDWGAEDGRHSWDPMLVLLALTGDEREAGYAVKTGTARVDRESGESFFQENPHGMHKFVVKLHENVCYEEKIQKIIG